MNGFIFDLQRFLNVTVTAGDTLVSGTSDADSIISEPDWDHLKNVTIDAGAGNDALRIYRNSNVSISAGDGDDYVEIGQEGKARNVTIITGAGNDTIKLYDSAQNITITDFDFSDKLKLSRYLYGANFAKFKNGILTINEIEVKLPNVTDISKFKDMTVCIEYHNDSGILTNEEFTLDELLDAPKPYWKVSGTTASYYDSNGKLLITLTGLKSGLKVTDGEITGIEIDGRNVILSQSVLGKSTVELSGDKVVDYSLCLADDVTLANFDGARWSVKDTTATCKLKAASAGYYLEDSLIYDNRRTIGYIAKNATINIVKITGIKKGTKVNSNGNIMHMDEFIQTLDRNNGDNGYLACNVSIDKASLFGNKISIKQEKFVGISFLGSSYDCTSQIIYEDYSGKTILGSDSGDCIVLGESKFESVNINSGKGDDYIGTGCGPSNNNMTINAGSGNDMINVVVNKENYIYAGDGDDCVMPHIGGSGNYIDLGNGNDFYISYGDIMSFNNNNNTIRGGKGNDTFEISRGKNFIQYANGDGNDTIFGYDSTDTLKISGDYSTVQDGENLIVNVGSGSITLLDFVGKANIEAVKGRGSEIKWTVSGTTATGKIDGKQVAKITGLKSGTKASALSGYGYDIFIPKSALTTTNVKITSDEYQLKLGNDVTVSDVTEAGWFIDGTKATYKTENSTLGYYLASDGKSITYKKAVASKTLTTLENLSADVTADDLTINTSKKTVTVKANALGTEGATTSDKYTLALDSGVTKSTTTAAKWTIDGDTAEYTTTKVTKGYVLSKDKKSVTYKTESGGDMVATLEGLKKGTKASDLSVKNGVITIGKNALNSKDVITLDTEENYTLAIDSGAKKSVITQEGWYTSNGTATYVTEKITAGYAVFDDGKSIEYISETDGGDTLVKLTGLKSKVKPADLSGTINGNVVTIAESVMGSSGVGVSGEGYEFKLSSAGKMTNKGKKVTLTGSSGDDILVGSKYADTISGGEGKDSLSGGNGADKLYANGDDTLIGGSGNDSLYAEGENNTLSGGSGKDSFYFTAGSALITDYSAGNDKIYLDVDYTYEISGKNVVFKTSGGTLTVKNGKGKNITVNDETKKYSASSGLFAEDNFVTADNLSQLVENNLSAVSEIESQNFDSLAQENLITYADK